MTAAVVPSGQNSPKYLCDPTLYEWECTEEETLYIASLIYLPAKWTSTVDEPDVPSKVECFGLKS